MKDERQMTDKKIKRAVVPLTILSVVTAALFIVITLYILGGRWYNGNVTSFDFSNADSISVSDIDGEQTVTLIGEDKAFAERFCTTKSAVSENVETPACFFDTVIITIVKDGKTYTVYPSADDCHNLAIDANGIRYYAGMAGSMETFKELLERNGIAWYWE